MTKAQRYAEKYVEEARFDPGFVEGFLAGVKWQKNLLTQKKDRKTKNCPLNKRGAYLICEKCPGIKNMEFCKL